MGYRFYAKGEPLPDLSLLLPETRSRYVSHAVSGACIYLILHELAHIELGHHRFHADSVKVFTANLVLDEKLTSFQNEEFQADLYALRSIAPAFQQVILSWMMSALQPFHFF